MSFNIDKETNPQQQLNIIIKLPINEIRDIVIKNKEYIKYLFYGNQREPTIIINKTQYITNNLYIWKGKIHNIPNIQYDGELIIETINGNQKTFLCFLLKQSYTITTPTIIDKLWNNVNQESFLFDLEKLLQTTNIEQSAIYYKDGINTIIISIIPIYINTNLKTHSPYPKCFIIPNFSNDYNMIKYKYIKSQSQLQNNNIQTIQENITSYIEGFNNTIIETELTEKGLYLDCAPTSQSTNTLNAITIPLDVNGNVNLSNSLLFSSIMNSLILFIIIAFVVLSLPSFYKFTIVDVINKINVPDKATRLKTVSYFIVFAILILSLSLIIDGIIIGRNIYQAYAGVLIGLMLCIGIIRIWFLQNNKDYSFQQIYNWNPIDIFVWLNEIHNYYIEHSNGIGFNYILFSFLISLLLLGPILSQKNFLPSTDTFLHSVTVILGYGLSYNIIMAFFVYLIYDTYKTN